MAARESLENLIQGLAGAVVEAQRRIEVQQIQNFRSFFDKDFRPKKLDIKVQSLRPDAKPGDDEIYRVPLLPLVASSLLKIKDVEISFDADLIDVKEDKKKSVNVDIRGGMFKKKAGTVHVVLRVEGREISEGMARLVDRLIQSQGSQEPRE